MQGKVDSSIRAKIYTSDDKRRRQVPSLAALIICFAARNTRLCVDLAELAPSSEAGVTEVAQAKDGFAMHPTMVCKLKLLIIV
jgi:hypothetical protein